MAKAKAMPSQNLSPNGTFLSSNGKIKRLGKGRNTTKGRGCPPKKKHVLILNFANVAVRHQVLIFSSSYVDF